MNKFIVPLLAAAVLAGGAAAQVHERGEQEARVQQAKAIQAGPYRSVQASGRLKRGEQLPPRYRAHNYVVEDWKAQRLTEPPPGHQWVRAGSDYALVAIATGEVQQVLVRR
ncbi:RcnB family protein [Massilia sp. UMI-21]|nr:RcnB family protein [Massilia sp. UMI-21]